MTSGRQLVAATLVLVGLSVVVLWDPIRSGGYFASTDVLQSSPLLRVAPEGYRVRNPWLSDPVHQMHPWLRWNRTELGERRLPVWNPTNGGGTPHLANSVSAVLSPFSVPWYVLPVRLALIAAAGLKLVVLGLFTYLFLRRVRLGHLAALVGAVGYAFCAYNLVWLSWPHPGAAVGLPAGLWCAELALQAPTPRRARVALAGWAVALAAGLLAGHPETFFYATVLALAYVAGRVAWARLPGRERLRLALGFGIGGVGALALAAVQLLPFFEYLRLSTALTEREATHELNFDAGLVFLHWFPSLFGSPSARYFDPTHLGVYANFNEANGFYIGLGLLFLAGIGVVSLARGPGRTFPTVFFTLAGAAWVVYAYDLGGLGEMVGSLPVVRTGLVGRSQVVWLFSAACLAAVGVDLLVRVGPSAALRLASPPRVGAVAGLAVAGAGILFVATTVVVVRAWIRERGPAATVATAVGRAVADAHVRFVAFTFLAVVAAAVVLVVGRHRGVKAVAGTALVGAVFAQSGWLLRDYNPTIERRYFYPVSPALATVRAAVGTDRVLFQSLLPPDANLWYGLFIPDTYDGLGVRQYDRLHRHLLARTDPRRVHRLLRTLGVEWVVSDDTHPFRVPATDPALSDPAGVTAVGPFDEAEPVSQRFVATAPDLSSVSVTAAPGPGEGACSLDLVLEDVASGSVVARSQAPCQSTHTVLSFGALRESAGREYRAVVRGAAYYAAVPTPDGGGEVGGHRASAPFRLVMSAEAEQDAGLEPVSTAGEVTLFRVTGSPGRWFSPAEARSVATDDEALAAIDAADFDPARTVLVHAPLPPSPGATGTGGSGVGRGGAVRVLEESPTEVRMEVRRDDPGWLVALQSRFPGWQATVNGREVPVQRADVAFSAVPVGGGASTVVLRYRPTSVRVGLLVSAVATLAVAGVVVEPAVTRRRRRRPAGSP